MDLSLSIEDISAITLPERIVGSTDRQVSRLSSLQEAQEGDLSFLGNPKYKKAVAGSQATLILVPADYEGTPGEGQVFFFQKSPTLALAQVCGRIEQRMWPKPAAGIHPSAVVAEGCKVAESASIGPLCVLEEGVEIGAGVVLQSQVFLGRQTVVGPDSCLMAHVAVHGHCKIGSRVRLHSGVVIGSDGFGYDTDAQGRHQKLPQVGEVVIGDDVEIGANTTIDRARFNRTEIGEGTKIDNLVQIGHNVIIGRHCIIISQVGIAGSATLEDYVLVGGQAGIAGHLHVGQGSMIAGKSGIHKDLPPKSYVGGAPSVPIMLEHKIGILRRRLPELFRDVQQLTETVKKLSKEG